MYKELLKSLSIRRKFLEASTIGESGMYKYTIAIALIEIDAIVKLIKDLEK